MIFNLLIVDDEAPIRKGLSEYIKWEDYDCKVVATANNGEDAITKINENDINIVLTDVKMPLLDGIGLAKYIHENRPDIAVIILSGYSEFEYARSAIQYHVSQYLLKPASKDQVIAAVKEVCEKIVTSKSNTRIKESELAFLKDQLFQQLTDSNVIDEEKQKKIDSFNLDFSHFYVAEAIEAVKEARAQGDLSENFEYYAAKKDKNKNEGRIRYLERVLKTATIISDESADDEVGLNNTVQVYFEDDDETETFKIVSTMRGDSISGRISGDSPMGAALMGHKVGDRVEVKVNEKVSYYVVIKSIENTGEEETDTIRTF